MNKGGPLSSIFKPYFEVGEAMANAIENIDAFIFDNYEIHSLGLYAGPKYINILVDGFNSEQINSQINSVELYACSSNNGHCPELRGGSAYQIQLTRKTINNEGSSWEIVENNTGSPKSAQLKIIWNNGRILWVPLTSKCSKLTGFGSNLRIDVRLKSGNRLAKHMADKIHIKKP